MAWEKRITHLLTAKSRGHVQRAITEGWGNKSVVSPASYQIRKKIQQFRSIPNLYGIGIVMASHDSSMEPPCKEALYL